MVFVFIIGLFFGFLMVSFGLVLIAKLGLILSGILVGVFGFLGSQRLAHQKPTGETIAGAVGTLLPVWLLPAFMESDLQIRVIWPMLTIITLSVLLGIGVMLWMERRTS